MNTQKNHPKCIIVSSLFECPKCDEKFGTSDLLNTHMTSSHVEESYSSFTMLSEGSLSDILVFHCDICSNGYESKEDMEKHRRLAHVRVVANKKRKINEETIEKSIEESTTKRAKINCSLCDKTFTRKDNLSRHFKNKH